MDNQLLGFTSFVTVVNRYRLISQKIGLGGYIACPGYFY
ncbi:hypothetical protein A343_0292 [Porphyromonas gingivalis JCVI SC001]|nr:hypothetical protein A343_0292 [Porphyromonas gingivalis JCVI SC001]